MLRKHNKETSHKLIRSDKIDVPNDKSWQSSMNC